MYYSKEMTEKARAVIAGEIDIPCPIGWHTLYESNVLCAYACTLLRLPDAGIDADAIGAEDIRIFQYGVEHNIETVTGIMYSHEAAGITDGRYDGVGGSDLYRPYKDGGAFCAAGSVKIKRRLLFCRMSCIIALYQRKIQYEEKIQ